MKPKKRQKLCCNCDGEIDLDVIVCPYCAADLREEKPEQQQAASTINRVRAFPNGQQQMSESLYPSSYTANEVKEPEVAAVESVAPSEQTVSEEKPNLTISATLLMTIGAQLLLLGTLLALFSNHGSVILQWDARLWFVYIFASVPFLIFGYRAVSKL